MYSDQLVLTAEILLSFTHTYFFLFSFPFLITVFPYTKLDMVIVDVQKNYITFLRTSAYTKWAGLLMLLKNKTIRAYTLLICKITSLIKELFAFYNLFLILKICLVGLYGCIGRTAYTLGISNLDLNSNHIYHLLGT